MNFKSRMILGLNIILILIIICLVYNQYKINYDFNNPNITLRISSKSAKAKDITLNAATLSYETDSKYGIPDDIALLETGLWILYEQTVINLEDFESGHIDCKYEEKDGVHYITYFGNLVDKDGNNVEYHDEVNFTLDYDFSVIQ